MKSWRLLTDRSLSTLLLMVTLMTPLFPAASFVYAAGDSLDNRFDQLSNPTPLALSLHRIGFSISDTGVPVGSVSIEFCSNSPLPGDACVVPVDFDASNAVLTNQTGETGFSISGLSTANHIILTRAAALPVAGPSVYTFSNIMNTSTVGTSYVRLQTFTSTDATGLNIEEGGIAYSISPGLSVSAEVPPYLRFCAAVTITGFDCSSATSFLIDLGEFTPTSTAKASSQFLVATNASFGYSVILSGTTMTSGNNTIPALTTNAPVNPGTSQFGLNLRQNTNPSIGGDPTGPGVGSVSANYNTSNLFRFQNGDTIAASGGSSDNTKFTVSYTVDISQGQPAGFYATTLTYICLANF